MSKFISDKLNVSIEEAKKLADKAFESQETAIDAIIKEELGIPIKYVGLGEKLDDLEHFDIEEYLYGMFGDVN